jgi:hypothetical protein
MRPTLLPYPPSNTASLIAASTFLGAENPAVLPLPCSDFLDGRKQVGNPVQRRVAVGGGNLRKTERRAFTRDLRAAHVSPYKVRGVLKEENNAMIRLADAICGLVRDADEGQAWADDVLRRLHQRGLIVQT